jgi:membrane protein implicated in regulation of membrane protease activity
MLEYFNENQASFWFALGALALIVELLVLGMSTIILFMLGIGALATGTLMYMGILGEGWLLGTAVTGIIAFAAGVLLWKPLKRYQEAEVPRSGESSDFLGMEFKLSSLLDVENTSTHQFSGVSWRVELAREDQDKSLAAGDRVRVVALHPGILVVAAI